jgi:hypothetical protein
VSFQDIQKPHEPIAERAGFKKIKDCCAQALAARFNYVWIDTCCIDKTNSTELSEAINSMFRWYQNAATCYAYLGDVSSSDTQPFTYSRWFTRGWTLQELIAPTDVLFFDQNWDEIGSRASLGEDISNITKIPFTALMNAPLQNHSVAEIMSWAAGRKTTRIEDRAYSLLGLFGVSMPMIYGEGEKAFLRLQLEIMKATTDHSLFAWRGIGVATGSDIKGNDRGALARSPDEFESSSSICSFPILDDTPYEMTNSRLRITLLCYRNSHLDGHNEHDLFARLNCQEAMVGGGFSKHFIGIKLRGIVKQGRFAGQYVRTQSWLLYEDPTNFKEEPQLNVLHIIQPDVHRSMIQDVTDNRLKKAQWGCLLDYSGILEEGYRLEAESTRGGIGGFEFKKSWDSKERIMREIGHDLRPWVLFFKHNKQKERFWVAFSIFEGRIFSMIEPKAGISDTPESILENQPAELASRGKDRWGGFDRVSKTLPDGNTVKLTARRGMITARLASLGYRVKIVVYPAVAA